jgi:hypothetical protein
MKRQYAKPMLTKAAVLLQAITAATSSAPVAH